MKKKSCIPFNPLILLLIILAGLASPVFSQSKNEMIDNLVLPLSKLSQSNSREQVYIQLSKGAYEAGEDLWFKAYILNSLTFSPSVLNKTLYVRVIREGSTRSFWQERYEIMKGSVGGHVYLPDTLMEGYYRLEAFTKGSFYKEEAEFKAFRRFRLVKDFKSLETKNSHDKKESGISSQKIQFGIFPEGGKLVSGISSRLAFKAVDTAGFPVDVSGTLLEGGKALQAFESVHAGMGSIVLTPGAGKKYTLQLKVPIDSIIHLPETTIDGISFHLSARDTSNLEFTITKPSNLPDTVIYLRGQMRGKTCFIAKAIINNEIKIQVPLNNFQNQGVAEFTVFDSRFIPIAERLVYLHPEKKLYIKAELSKPGYGQREKAELHLKTFDEKGHPVQAELAISVYDKLYSNEGDAVNLLTYSFLSTQLKGRIYNPAFYFEENNKGREEAMDLLLLTQGWRNYVWNEESLKAEGAKQAVVFDETYGTVSFTKRLKQSPTGQLVKSFMSDSMGKPKTSVMIFPGTTGKFVVSPATLKAGQGVNIYLKPMGPEEYGPRIKISDPFQVIDTITKLKKYIVPYKADVEKHTAQSILSASMDSRMFRLKEVKIVGAGTKTFRDKYLGKLDSLAKIDPNGAFVCKHGYLNNYVPGYYHVFGAISAPACTDTLTSTPVEGKLYTILKYESLGRADGRWILTGQAKAVYHNPNKGLSEDEILKLYNLSKLSGYYPKKEFYQPDYDKEPNGDGSTDARNTLLWAPSVLTDAKGEASLTFFCSDINSDFVIQAEGITTNGLLDTQQIEFKVLKSKKSVLNN